MSGGKPQATVLAPCLDCEVRQPACHDRCERYAEYRKELMRIRDSRRESDAELYLRTDRHAQTKVSSMARKNMRLKRRNNTQ